MYIKYLIAINCFLLFCKVNGQNSSFEKEFKTLNTSSKVSFYESLNDSVKRINSSFLKNEFTSIDVENNTTENAKNIKFIIAQLHFHSEDYIESINMFNSFFEQKKYRLTQKDSMSVYDELKKSYYQLYLYTEVFEVNSKIQKLIDNGAEYPLWSYNMNSTLYARLKQYNKAIIALKKEIQVLEKSNINDPLIIPSAYNDLGYYFFKSKRNDSALVSFQKSLKYAEKSLKQTNEKSYEQLIGVVKGNIAGVYVQRKNYIEAVAFLKEDIDVGLRTKTNLESTFYSYSLLIKCYLELKNYNTALSTINTAEQYLPELNNQKPLSEFYTTKSEYFNNIGKIDSAYFYLNKAYEIKDSLETKGMNKILASNELMHSITEKQKLLKQHQVDLKNQELKLKNTQKNIFIFFTTLLLLLLFLSLYNVFKLKKSKKEIGLKNNQILSQNEKIKETLDEKEVLLKEVHHRVKNNLQVISGLLELQNITVSDDSVKLALKEGQNRIQSVALVHKMMYQSESVSKVNMGKYLDELLQVLQTSYAVSGKNITTKINASNIDLDITFAVPLSLIVNEAVCNAYKHAFVDVIEGEIFVSIERESTKTYKLIIKDNGIGLPSGFDISNLKSIGFDLIKGLTKQLKGSLQLNTNYGTEIIITFLNNDFNERNS
jgi:two-component sensor histidine kinase